MSSVSGLKEIQAKMKSIVEASTRAQATGIEKALTEIAKESLKECPVLDGALRESMTIDVNGTTIAKGTKDGAVSRAGSVPNRAELQGSISYNTPYAVKQHEDMSLKHPTDGTKAKFLEDPFKRSATNAEIKIREEIGKVIK